MGSFGVERLRTEPLQSGHGRAGKRRVVAGTVVAIVLAVGVSFATGNFAVARNTAIGIGIQNFPEGLAVSLPLRAQGMSSHWAFFWGQLSGMFEPLAGIAGCWLATEADFILPYALAFAAGAMVFVVVDDIIPEVQVKYNFVYKNHFVF